ncbi:diguanylate cyclase [bacterium]|nr:diguanylate cyclase [bacterium]
MLNDDIDIGSNEDFLDWSRVREYLIKAGGGTLYPVSINEPTFSPQNNNELCSLLQKRALGRNRCVAIHQLHFREVTKNLRPTLFRCHAGFWNFAIPLHYEGTCLGAVMGCGILDQSRNTLDYKLLAQEIDLEYDELLAAIRKVPLLTKAKIKAFQSLLSLFLQDVLRAKILCNRADHTLQRFENAILKYNTIYKIYKVTRTTPDFTHLLAGLVTIIVDDTNSDAVLIYVLNERDELVLVGTSESDRTAIGERLYAGSVLNSILSDYDYSDIRGHTIPDVPTHSSQVQTDFSMYQDELMVPLISNLVVIGMISLKSIKPGHYDRNNRHFLTFIHVLSSQCAIAIENTLLRHQTELLILTDEMTGLYNFRYFSQKLVEEITRCTRYGHVLSLIMIDLDQFKLFNDSFGHPSGDVALKTFANILKSSIRDVDIAVRYGGEEFAVILPETDPREACLIIDRIRNKVANHDFCPSGHEREQGLTISAGVAAFPMDAQTADDLIGHADQALYLSKRQGRNRINCYSS